MDRAELVASFAAAPPSAEDVVYVERRGAQYVWTLVGPDAGPAVAGPNADVWMYFSGDWPRGDPAHTEAFCADMLAELESMAGGDDRCRWPLDQPWPRPH